DRLAVRGHRVRAARRLHRSGARGDGAEECAAGSDRSNGAHHRRGEQSVRVLLAGRIGDLSADHRRDFSRRLPTVWRRGRLQANLRGDVLRVDAGHNQKYSADGDRRRARSVGARSGDAASLESRVPHVAQSESAALHAAVEARRLHDLDAGSVHHRLRVRCEILESEIGGNRHRPVARGHAVEPDRSGNSDDAAMKRPLIIAGAVLVLAIIVFASVRAGGTKSEKVYAEPVKARKIEAVVTAPGEVDPKVKVNIDAHIVGKIEHIYFNEGDTVHRGQKLVELEQYAYLAARDRAKAAVMAAHIEVTRAKVALDTADLEYKRALSMKQQGIQAQELLDKAQLDLENARAGYQSSQEGVRQAEAALAQAETDLSHTTIISPIDGKAVQLNAHEGEVVVTGTMNNPASVIAVIADLSEILVESDVNETDVVALRLGMPAKVHVDAVTDKEYTGKVAEIGSSATARQSAGAGIRYFKVKVAIENPDDRLRPGMTSQVTIITSTALNALTVPIQSVVERVPPNQARKKGDDEEDENLPRKKYVFVVKNGKAKMTEVTTGISDATHVALLSGLKNADPVVTGPFRTLKKLKDGDAVEVTKEEPKKSETE